VKKEMPRRDDPTGKAFTQPPLAVRGLQVGMYERLAVRMSMV